MKMQDIIVSMARMLGLDATDLESGYEAFKSDFLAQEGITC